LSVVGALLLSLGLGRLPRQASGALLLALGIWTLLPLVVPAHSPADAVAIESIPHHH